MSPRTDDDGDDDDGDNDGDGDGDCDGDDGDGDDCTSQCHREQMGAARLVESASYYLRTKIQPGALSHILQSFRNHSPSKIFELSQLSHNW